MFRGGPHQGKIPRCYPEYRTNHAECALSMSAKAAIQAIFMPRHYRTWCVSDEAECARSTALPGHAGLLAIWNSPYPRFSRRPFGGALCPVCTSLCKSSIRFYLALVHNGLRASTLLSSTVLSVLAPTMGMQSLPLRGGS